MRKYYFQINNGVFFQFNRINSILRAIRKPWDKKKHWGTGYQKGVFNKYKKDQFLYETGITTLCQGCTWFQWIALIRREANLDN